MPSKRHAKTVVQLAADDDPVPRAANSTLHRDEKCRALRGE
jgi:hypothetical protein